MKRADGQIVYSPSDLVRFIQSPYVAWMERTYLDRPEGLEPDPEDEQLAMFARKGDQHEQACLEGFRRRGIEPSVIGPEDALDATRRALAERKGVIYQGCLADGVFQGFADFLVLGEAIGVRSSGYVVLDAKLARHVRPYFLLQLCCYADMLSATTGGRTEHVGVLLGDGMQPIYRLDDFHYYYRHVREQFLALMDRYPHGPAPDPDPMGELGRWRSHAEAWVHERDHLSQVANITRGQIRRLESVGIKTVGDLSRAQADHVRGIEPGSLARLQQQARLQIATRESGEPTWELIAPEAGRSPPLDGLPPADEGDVYFDIEGYPLAEGGLEYLLGAVTTSDGATVFHDWWAHGSEQERLAFTAFVDWVIERRRIHPRMHVYHYGHYETTALKRLMGKYGVREDAVDDLLRNGVFVDLYRIFTQSVRVGEPGYSLKNLERLWSGGRSGDVATAGDSVVYYDAWIESGEPEDWQQSGLLRAIRDYNEEDCVSTWKLAEWLRDLQSTSRAYAGGPDASSAEDADAEPTPVSEAVARPLALAESLLALGRDENEPAGDRCIHDMLGWLVDFHRRCDKPVWWAYFDRLERTEEELADDLDCLAGLEVVSVEEHGRSFMMRCRFNPDQDTKLKAGSQVTIVANGGVRASLDVLERNGTLVLRVGGKQLQNQGFQTAADLPRRFSVIPYEYISAAPIEASIEKTAQEWRDSRCLRPAVRDFLFKSTPRLRGCDAGDIAKPGEDNVSAGIRVARALDESVLCIQGPPGTGKTYTAARIISGLLADGKNVGISSNSHKAVLNLMKGIYDLDPEVARMIKVGGDEDDPALADRPLIRWMKTGRDGAEGYDGGLIGGTAWLFSREDMEDSLDYLFVDEAGQVSVGNLLGMSRSTRNIVLMGDQMQLGQPIQGSHPGESGLSILEYYLAGRQTIPPDKGLFLGTSWRMHPDICSFISEAMYERRLGPEAHTSNRRILVPDSAGRIRNEAGIVFVPVEHSGNTQSSDEEVDVVEGLVEELLGRDLLGDDGTVVKHLSLAEDFLFVAPFNMQVRKLERRLGPNARVGSVDKFQGQEAPVVIVSLCSSDGEGSRGVDFVLDRNRLNVAVSRAQSLAIVVGSPRIGLAVPNSVDSMKRLNLFHQMRHFSKEA